MKYIPKSDENLVSTLELTRRNLEILLAKLDDPNSERTLMDPDRRIFVKAVEDSEHYKTRGAGPMWMPTAEEWR